VRGANIKKNRKKKKGKQFSHEKLTDSSRIFGTNRRERTDVREPKGQTKDKGGWNIAEKKKNMYSGKLRTEKRWR